MFQTFSNYISQTEDNRTNIAIIYKLLIIRSFAEGDTQTWEYFHDLVKNIWMIYNYYG